MVLSLLFTPQFGAFMRSPSSCSSAQSSSSSKAIESGKGGGEEELNKKENEEEEEDEILSRSMCSLRRDGNVDNRKRGMSKRVMEC